MRARSGQPQASRPHMQGYGLLPADEGEGLLPWSWAVGRMASQRNFWLTTISSDQPSAPRPHSMAVWGLWSAGGFWFSTAATTRKARNLAHNSACVLTTDDAEAALIIEGEVELIDSESEIDELRVLYAEKYGMPFPPSAVYCVVPVRAFGIIEEASRFAGCATRWVF